MARRKVLSSPAEEPVDRVAAAVHRRFRPPGGPSYQWHEIRFAQTGSSEVRHGRLPTRLTHSNQEVPITGNRTRESQSSETREDYCILEDDGDAAKTRRPRVNPG